MRLEDSIFNNLIHDESYARKVLPFLKTEYFKDKADKVCLELIYNFFTKYGKIPTAQVLKLELENRNDITQDELTTIDNTLESLRVKDEVDGEWLVNETEEFCKRKALTNAIYDSIFIMDGKDKNRSPDSIPDLLSKALAVSFDSNVGHSYFENADERFEFYHRQENRIPFHLDIFNKITDGGLPNKTLSCVISGPGGGKSLFLCDYAAAALTQGKNVLYITMEMAEERISERIDANLFNIPIKEIKHLDKKTFDTKIDRIKKATVGKLVVKEYPTGAAHAGHFRALIEELKIKQEFKPDVVIVDYLNICASQRTKIGGSINSYTVVKSISEELRGLAVFYDVPILTATQTNREGITASDVDMTNTSESIGLPQTLDFFFALIRTEELDELGQIMVKQLKNRYNDLSYYRKFVIGVDLTRMKLFDVEQSAQDDISDKGKTEDDIPLFDKSKYADNDEWKF